VFCVMVMGKIENNEFRKLENDENLTEELQGKKSCKLKTKSSF